MKTFITYSYELTSMNRTIINILLFSAELLLFLLLFELFLRTAMPQNTCVYRFNEIGFYMPLPFSKCVWVGYNKEFVTPVSFNSEGFKEYNYAVNKTNTTYRIAIIGDSMVEALQVPLDNIFTKLLEQKLNRPLKKYEIIGFGLSGIGTIQEQKLLEAYALKYSPDEVILMLTVGNDIRDNLLLNSTLIAANKPAKIWGFDYSPIKFFLRQHFHTFAFLVDASRVIKQNLLTKIRSISSAKTASISKNIYDYDFEIYYQNYSTEINHGFSKTEEALLQIKKMSPKLTVFLIPTTFQVDEFRAQKFIELHKQHNVNLTKPMDILVTFCNNHNITIINPLPEFQKHNINNTFFWKYDGHLNKNGHTLVADLLYQDITKTK